jgi:long-subunit fatty acid transport protein
MKKFLAGVAAIAVTAGTAQAGGLDRTGQGIDFMFEKGNVVELRFGSVNANISGTVGGGAVSSGNIAENYTQVALGYKQELNDKLSIGILFDQPFGADVAYPTGTGYPFQGATASVDTNAITAVLRYRISDRVAVHGGVRAIRTEGQVGNLTVDLNPDPMVFTPGIYNMNTDTQTDFGYLIGATYEIPDIALRAAITYNSEVEQDFTTQQQIGMTTLPEAPMTIVKPKSVNLDFQTGIAPGTLLMASARWVNWSNFDITPTGLGGASLVEYDSDTTTYSLGVGRQLTDKLSGSVTLGYEAGDGTLSGNLGPTDGFRSITLGLKYQVSEGTAISGGVRRVWLGDATTSTVGGEFTNNTATGFGVKLTHSF